MNKSPMIYYVKRLQNDWKVGGALSILTVQNLSKQFKKQSVINGISLTIDEPGTWALIGPNGVRKKTLLNLITNLIPAISGSAELVGKSNKDRSVFKRVSFLQKNTVLFDYLKGYDHLKYICDVHNLPKKRVQKNGKLFEKTA